MLTGILIIASIALLFGCVYFWRVGSELEASLRFTWNREDGLIQMLSAKRRDNSLLTMRLATARSETAAAKQEGERVALQRDEARQDYARAENARDNAVDRVVELMVRCGEQETEIAGLKELKEKWHAESHAICNRSVALFDALSPFALAYSRSRPNLVGIKHYRAALAAHGGYPAPKKTKKRGAA